MPDPACYRANLFIFHVCFLNRESTNYVRGVWGRGTGGEVGKRKRNILQGRNIPQFHMGEMAGQGANKEEVQD